jgi:hypothetical protein
MNSLIFLAMTGSFVLFAYYFPSLIAKEHYKTYKGNQPLYIVYSLIGAIIWGTITSYFII